MVYRGEVTGVTVTASQTNSAGTIVANLFCPTPTAPEDGSTVTNGAFSFEWNPIAGGSEYQIQVSTGSTFETTAIDTTTVSTTYAPPELSFGETYYWRVKAKDSYGNESDWSEVWSFTVSTQPGVAPSAPANVTAAAGDGQVSISWDSVSGATSYNIYWATWSGVAKTDYEGKIEDIAETPYTETDLTNDTTYYYVVTAENSYGEGDESDEINATPEAGENTPPQLSDGYVSPESGTTIDRFRFYVDYYDADGDYPATRYVYIDGTAYTMQLYSGSLSNGTYSSEATLGAGTHTFYFEFTDGNGATSRLPTTGTYSGPEVETTVVTVTGKISNNGQPVVNLLMKICDYTNHPETTLIDESHTDSEGVFSFSFNHDPEVTPYVISGWKNPDKTFEDWAHHITSIESDRIVLPDFDIYYDELFSPLDGATYKADDINDSNPIVFEWTDGGRSDIIFYSIAICPEGEETILGETTDSTTYSFDGILDDGTKITAGTYEWTWWCHFGASGWHARSGVKTLIIE